MDLFLFFIENSEVIFTSTELWENKEKIYKNLVGKVK